jgi:hypothetical protein
MKKILIFGLTFIFEGVGLYAVHSSTIRYDYGRVINHPIIKTITIRSIGKKLLGDAAGK